MPRFFLIFILSFLAVATDAQDVTYLTREAGQLEKDKKDEEALKKYEEALVISPSDEVSLCRGSILNSTIGRRQQDKKMKQDYYAAARTYAETALRQYPKSAEAHYAMALALTWTSASGNIKERMQGVSEIKKHLDSALSINPDHARSHFLMGKWNMEVSGMNVAEKGALKLAFGGLPSASISSAIYEYEVCRKKDPNFILNYLELARAYKANGQSDKSIEVLNRMLKLPPKTIDDPGYKEEGKSLLESLL